MSELGKHFQLAIDNYQINKNLIKKFCAMKSIPLEKRWDIFVMFDLGDIASEFWDFREDDSPFLGLVNDDGESAIVEHLDSFLADAKYSTLPMYLSAETVIDLYDTYDEDSSVFKEYCLQNFQKGCFIN